MQKIYSALILLLGLLLGACDTNSEFELQTELLVEVLGTDFNPQAGATVTLYLSKLDLETRLRPRFVAETDANGIARFEGVAAEIYYVHATYDDGDDFYDNRGDESLIEPLVEGSLTYYFTGLDYRRPSEPIGFEISEVWLMAYYTEPREDEPIFEESFVDNIDIIYGDDFYNNYGDFEFFRYTYGGGIPQDELSVGYPDFDPDLIFIDDIEEFNPLFELSFNDDEGNQIDAGGGDFASLFEQYEPYPDRIRAYNFVNEVIVDFYIDWY